MESRHIHYATSNRMLEVEASLQVGIPTPEGAKDFADRILSGLRANVIELERRKVESLLVAQCSSQSYDSRILRLTAGHLAGLRQPQEPSPRKVFHESLKLRELFWSKFADERLILIKVQDGDDIVLGNVS
jgi:hypothetical protein